MCLLLQVLINTSGALMSRSVLNSPYYLDIIPTEIEHSLSAKVTMCLYIDKVLSQYIPDLINI